MNLQLNNNTFYIKRDDLLPISFGGNKARKAILFLKDLESKKADCILTYGSSSSNHCRIIANIAAAKKLPCYIISPNETNKRTTNSKMIELLNAEVIYCPIDEIGLTIESQISTLEKIGRHPYFIPGGGHGDIGTQAYVEAYEEILYYEKYLEQPFDYIFHSSGTGTTQAGLICGSLLNQDNKKIVGISIARKSPMGGQIVLDSANSYLKSIDKDLITNEKVCFVDQYVLNGYGAYNEKILTTIKDVFILDGVPMDTTYTGKGLWGMKEYIKSNQISGKKILFIHTGGTPLFFDDLGELFNG